MKRFAAFVGLLLLAVPAAAQNFTPSSGTVPPGTSFTATGGTSPQTLANFGAYSIYVPNYMPGGGVPDGTVHPLSNYFASAAVAEAACPSLATLIGPNSFTANSHTSTTLDTISSMIGVIPGAIIVDVTNPSSLPANTTVSSIGASGATTQAVTLSAAATASNTGDTYQVSESATWWQGVSRDWCAGDAALRYIVAKDNAAGSGAVNNYQLVFGSFNYNFGALPFNLSCYSDANPVSNSIASIANDGGLIEVGVSTAKYLTGMQVIIAGVAANTGANGTWIITVVDGSHVTLNGSTYANSASAGGAASIQDGCGSQSYSHGRLVIDMRGTQIASAAAGQAVLAGLGSRGITIWGGTVTGNCTSPPAYAYLTGRTIYAIGADQWEFGGGFQTEGCFSGTQFINEASEGQTLYGGLLQNSQNSGLPFAGILDGGNYWLVGDADPYVTVNVPRNTPQSFNGFQAIGTQFYPTTGTSSGLWIYGANFPRFQQSYVTTADGVCHRLYATNAASVTYGAYFDIHCESIGSTAVATAFLLTGSYATPVLTDFYYKDMFVFAGTDIFALDTGLTGGTIDPRGVWAYPVSGGTPALFDTAGNWTVTHPELMHIGSGITGWAPSITSCSGAGTSGSCALFTGSTISDGEIALTMGGSSIGSSGAAVFSTGGVNIGAHRMVCVSTLANGNIAPPEPAGVVMSGSSPQTAQTFNWYFNSAPSSGNSVNIPYHCRGI